MHVTQALLQLLLDQEMRRDDVGAEHHVVGRNAKTLFLASRLRLHDLRPIGFGRALDGLGRRAGRASAARAAAARATASSAGA